MCRATITLHLASRENDRLASIAPLEDTLLTVRNDPLPVTKTSQIHGCVVRVTFLATDACLNKLRDTLNRMLS